MFTSLLFLFTASFLGPSLGLASGQEAWITKNHGNCFSAHLKEAIEVHRLRRGTYSLLSQGHSRHLSNEIIFLDRIGIPVARFFDAQSKKILTRRGVPFLCEVIPSILPVLEKEVIRTAPISLEEFKPFSASNASRAIHRAHKQGGLLYAQTVLRKLKSDLEQTPQFNCLARQFISSMDLMIDVERENPSRRAEKLTWNVIRATLLQLRVLVLLDRSAVILQAQGIPLLCSEIPELPKFL